MFKPRAFLLSRNSLKSVVCIDNDNRLRAVREKQLKDFTVTGTGCWWQLSATGLKAKELGVRLQGHLAVAKL